MWILRSSLETYRLAEQLILLRSWGRRNITSPNVFLHAQNYWKNNYKEEQANIQSEKGVYTLQWFIDQYIMDGYKKNPSIETWKGSDQRSFFSITTIKNNLCVTNKSWVDEID